MNKKGSAYVFIYGLLFLGALAILFIVLNQVIQVNIYPMTNDTNIYNMSATDMQEIDDKLSFWNFMPIVFILLVVVYWIYHTANDNTGVY